jgi:hypothetical protein
MATIINILERTRGGGGGGGGGRAGNRGVRLVTVVTLLLFAITIATVQEVTEGQDEAADELCVAITQDLTKGPYRNRAFCQYI